MDSSKYDMFWRKRCQSEFKRLQHKKEVKQIREPPLDSSKFISHTKTVRDWNLRNPVGISDDSLSYIRTGTAFSNSRQIKTPSVKWAEPSEEVTYLNGRFVKTNKFKEYHLGIKNPACLGFCEQ